mgnify:CR=1 FL=1
MNIAMSIKLILKKSKIRVSINTDNIVNPKKKNLASRPSRKMGNINALKTNAEPGSGWAVINIMGTKIIALTIITVSYTHLRAHET